jgi:TonB family protein
MRALLLAVLGLTTLSCARGAESQRILDVTDKPPDPGRSHNEAGASWNERLVRVNETKTCGKPETRCSPLVLVVRNDSAGRPLNCSGSIRLPPSNARGISDANDRQPRLIGPGDSAVVAKLVAPLDVEADFESECVPSSAPLPPPPPRADEPDCKHVMSKAVNLDDYYPPAARREERQGRVVVQALLSKAEGPAEIVELAGSSSFADLDEAGLRAIRDTVFKTTCPGSSVTFAVKFSIKE